VQQNPEVTSLRYVYTLPVSEPFTGKGLLGYAFGPLRQNIDVYYIEVEKGHDTFMISKKISRIYHVLAGSGYFTIDGVKYDVCPGVIVEVPPKVEYSYSGKMTLIGFATPRWFRGNDTHTRWNRDVVERDYPCEGASASWLTRLVRFRILGRSPVGSYLRLSQQLWNRLPSFLTSRRPVSSYGRFLHALARIHGDRAQAFSTHFLRNRPQLEVICNLLELASGETLRLAVLGCSTGAEAYSIAWKIQSARPGMKIVISAVDISRQAVEVAKRGVYSLTTSQLTNARIFDRMTPAEMQELFDKNGDAVTVKPWIKDGINWHVADVGETEILEVLGAQDIVVANNFLCHMDDLEAERCLQNIVRLVKPGGYLFVSGVDLDLRTRVARDLGWKPVETLLEQIHEGDTSLKSFWPCHYGGLEPLDKTRGDWKIRYAAAFQLPSNTNAAIARQERELANV